MKLLYMLVIRTFSGTHGFMHGPLYVGPWVYDCIKHPNVGLFSIYLVNFNNVSVSVTFITSHRVQYHFSIT